MEDIISKSLKQAQDVLQAFVSNPDTVSRMASGGRYARGRFGKRKQDSQLRQRRVAVRRGAFRRGADRPFPPRPPAAAAMAINDAAYMTCVGNDFSFDQIFARWVEAFGRPGDVLLAISTSGNSGNVVMAVEKAREAGMKVLALTREGTNKLSEMADVAICAPTAPYSDRIQEIHIKVIHILIEALEAAVIYKDGTGER